MLWSPARARRARRDMERILPSDLVTRVERLRRMSGGTRSDVIRRSLELLLEDVEHARRLRRYVEGYAAEPESNGEVDAAVATGCAALAESPWD